MSLYADNLFLVELRGRIQLHGRDSMRGTAMDISPQLSA